MDIVSLIAGFIIGAIIGAGIIFIIQNSKINKLYKENAEAEANLKFLKEKITEEQKSQNELQESLTLTFKNIGNELFELNSKKLSEKNLEILKPFKEKIAELEKKIQEDSEKRSLLISQFENANDSILEKNTNKLSEKHSEILKPFKEKIAEFEKNLKEDGEKRASLDTLVKEYQNQCVKISDEAANLTNALKADVKKKGCWGEFILERTLESSGLQKDREYKTEDSFNTEDGRYRPDAVIYLPNDRHVVIDSKVPLNSFVNFYNESNEQKKENCRTEFISAIETVIKGLGEKAYENIDELKSPDFVLLFIPLEGAFSLIYNEFNPIIQSAWDKRIIIVSPSTLLAALRTIRAFWREENQAKNVKEIAEESGKLYDKFVLLLNDLLQIRKEFDKTSNLFNDACNKIKDGSGNLIRRVEKIKKLGAKTTKQIPAEFSEEAEEEIGKIEEIKEIIAN